MRRAPHGAKNGLSRPPERDDGTGAHAQDALRDAAEERPRHALSPVGPHHDEIRVDRGGELVDLGSGIAPARDRRELDGRGGAALLQGFLEQLLGLHLALVGAEDVQDDDAAFQEPRERRRIVERIAGQLAVVERNEDSLGRTHARDPQQESHHRVSSLFSRVFHTSHRGGRAESAHRRAGVRGRRFVEPQRIPLEAATKR